ncbi:MAG: cysteine--tRNA ligase [Acidimicrobiales bacterium]
MLRLHDTALGRISSLPGLESGRLSMYVCGPTVYDDPHVGHGRLLLVYDVLRRYLEWTGVQVSHVSNVTDIDDNIINRAKDTGQSPSELAFRYEERWWEAADALGALRPHHAPRATEYVARMVDLVAELIGRGAAYELGDGVYFAVSSVPDYGLLAQQSLESLRAGARIEADRSKRSPEDFALWKLSAPGEPAWPSPWGPGRPGWHTECVVMSLDLLGEGFDLHTGGLDLKFPHHENERAQAVALGRDFAHHWMHHAFVEVAGEKMSKSVGNFISLTDLLSREDSRAYRMLVLQAHYRSPVEVTPDTIARASSTLERLDVFAGRFPAAFAGSRPAPPSAPALGPRDEPSVLDRFRGAMDDDLDTPRAMAIVSDALRQANAAADAGRADEAQSLAAALAEMTAALGLFPDSSGSGDGVPPDVAELVAALDAARSGRDFPAADAIRAELTAQGWLVETGPEASRVRRRRD